MHACDGQTDRILLAIPRLHYMQRGKNYRAVIHEYINMSVTGVYRRASVRLGAKPMVRESFSFSDVEERTK